MQTWVYKHASIRIVKTYLNVLVFQKDLYYEMPTKLCHDLPMYFYFSIVGFKQNKILRID